MKKIINLFLLVVMSFSIAHGVVFLEQFADEPCSMQKHVTECSIPDAPDHKHDECDGHCMFHISFLLPNTLSLYDLREKSFVPQIQLSKNHFLYEETTFRPPIV
jgi:hypothetical protein